jgi:hypothetical protein
MKILDRFTRDRQSRFIWGGATAVFLVLVLLALAGGLRTLSSEERAAEDRAVEYTDTVLFDALDADLLADEIRGRNYRDLIIQVQGGIMTDEGVARVRVWAPDGTLLFSTESLEQIGVARAVNSEPIDAAVGGEVSSVVSEATVAAKSGLSGTTQRLYQTFAPIRVRERTAIVGVAEIDRTYSSIADAAAQPWRSLQIGFGVATLLCAVMLLLSLRRSTSTLGRAVGITPLSSDVPSGPVPADRNALRLRNELERERQANRTLQAELEAAALGLGPSGAPAAPAVDPEAAARLAEAERALAEADAHAAELERSLVEARAQAVSTEALAGLEERVLSAEGRAREAEVRLQALTAAGGVAAPEPGRAPSAPSPEAPAPSAPPGGPVPSTPTSEVPAEDAPADEPAPKAMDLRSRLARTAARKKLGSHVDDEPGA